MSAMTNKITVLLADDHRLVRRGFRRMLEDDPDLVVVGEASDGDEAVRLAAQPRAARRRHGLRDARHERTGRDAAHSRSAGRDVAVLMLSMHSEQTLVPQALEAGARGYILKNALDLDLAAAVKRVAAGETVLDPTVTLPATLKGERNHGLTRARARGAAADLPGPLQPRDRRQAEPEREHRARPPRQHHGRLGVHKTAELVVYALRHGLVGPL